MEIENALWEETALEQLRTAYGVATACYESWQQVPHGVLPFGSDSHCASGVEFSQRGVQGFADRKMAG